MKKYALTAHRKSGYLHIRVTGANRPEAVRGYLQEVQAACIRGKHLAVLLEECLEGPEMRLLDVYSLASAGAELLPHPLLRIAFVDTNPEHQPAMLQFAENVAVNRGANLRVFPNVRKAQAWLVSSQKTAGRKGRTAGKKRPAG